MGALCCALSWAYPLRVHARPLRALVCVEGGDDAALLARVRGQTGDLGVRLVPAQCDLADDFAAQLARAKDVSAARATELAVWFVRRAQRLVVYVAEPASERVFARGLDEGSGPHAASARDEAAALVVRSAVRAALAGTALDTPAPERVSVVTAPTRESKPAPTNPEAAATPTPPPKQAAQPQQAAQPPAPAARAPAAARPRRTGPRRVDAWLALRAQAGLDGFATTGRYAYGARLGLRRRWLEVGVSGLAGLPVARDVALGRLTLARHRFGAYGAFAVLARETTRLALELEAGAELSSLRVKQADPDLSATSSRSLLAWIGAAVRLSYVPRWSGGRLGLAPALGLVALPERPSLGYRAGAAFVPVRRLYRVEPIVEIAVAVRF